MFSPPLKTDRYTDAELLAMLRADNREAFDAIYQQHWQQLYNAAYKRLKRRDLSKDIVQDVFIDLWNRRHNSNILDLQAYLHTAVRYQVLKLVTRGRITTQPERFTSITTKQTDEADALVLGKEFFAFIDTWMAALPKKRKKIFRMHYMEDMPTGDIARELNISQKTVQNQLGSAWNELQAKLANPTLIIVSLFHLLV